MSSTGEPLGRVQRRAEHGRELVVGLASWGGARVVLQVMQSALWETLAKYSSGGGGGRHSGGGGALHFLRHWSCQHTLLRPHHTTAAQLQLRQHCQEAPTGLHAKNGSRVPRQASATAAQCWKRRGSLVWRRRAARGPHAERAPARVFPTRSSVLPCRLRRPQWHPADVPRRQQGRVEHQGAPRRGRRSAAAACRCLAVPPPCAI